MINIIPNWHPVFVHFTVALLTTAILFQALAFAIHGSRFRDQWRVVARWNLWVGAGFAVITGLTGWLAYDSVAHDTPSHLAMTDHRNWAFATLTIFVPLALWSIWLAYKGKGTNLVMMYLMVVGLGVLASTAWRGGEVVYRHGLGVMSLPEPVLMNMPRINTPTESGSSAEPSSAHGHVHDSDGHSHEH